jgi:CRP-like cAMP-binding protein
MLGSFFNYPSGDEVDESQEMVFLGEWDGEKWNKLLQHTQVRRFKAGENVIHKGDVDRAFYIVIEGSLDVLIPKGNTGRMQSVATVTAGTVTGEQAFLDSRPRSATLRAITDGEMLSLSLEAFEVFAAYYPELARDILLDLARILSVKLRNANKFITSRVK